MIVADTSAFAAIIMGEPDAEVFAWKLAHAAIVVIGAPTAFELRLAMHKRKGIAVAAEVDRLLTRPNIRTVPFGPEHVSIASEALVRFGGRPAKLNFGDCMSYAVAKAHDAPLLFKGDDFVRTDIRSAL